MGKRVQKVPLKNLETKTLNLGYVGENIHTQIEIDCSEVLWDYPQATASMVVQPPMGDMYPVTPERDGDDIIWTVTDSDLIYSGTGSVQLTFTNDGEVVKSAIGMTRVRPSIVATGPVPTPLENWMEQAEATAQEIALTAKDEVIEQIQDAAEEARESIPADYSQLSDDVSDLKSAFEQLNDNVIVDSAGPAFIVSIADGADGMPMRSVEVAIEPVQDLHGYDAPWPAGGGKNLLQTDISIAATLNPTYTLSGNTLSYGGVTFTFNADGTVTANGTANDGNVFCVLNTASFLSDSPTNTYRLSGCPASGGSGTYNMDVQGASGADTGSGAVIAYSGTLTNTNVRIRIYNGTSVSNIVFKPMICLASATDPTAYAPYSNICPISGWTGAKVTRTGVNVWDEEWELGQYNNLTGLPIDTNDCIRTRNPISVKPNMTYYTTYGAGKMQAFFYKADETYIGNAWVGATNLITTPDGCALMRFRLASTYGTTYGNDISINYPATDTEYHAYQGQTYEVAFPTEAGTVYGGTLDVTAGTLTVDRAMVDLGERSWSYNSTNKLFFSAEDNGIKQPATDLEVSKALSNVYCTYSVSGMQSASVVNGVCIGKTGYFVNRIVVKDLAYTESTAFKTALTNMGAKLCYEINTPIEITGLDQATIATLLGVNNIWSDAGDTAVTYPADTKLYIDKKIAELQALILENNG